VGRVILPTFTLAHLSATFVRQSEEIVMDKSIQLRPDAKGRINLGKLAQGISSFRVRRTEDGSIILEPFSEIPAREKWLFDNKTALGAVNGGLKQAAAGQNRSLGSFAQYADEDID
jgi:hypothetical protein